MTNPLIEKAKSVKISPRKLNYSDNHIELAVAWAKSEVNLKQCKKAIGEKYSANMYTFFAIALREAVRRGMLK